MKSIDATKIVERVLTECARMNAHEGLESCYILSLLVAAQIEGHVRGMIDGLGRNVHANDETAIDEQRAAAFGNAIRIAKKYLANGDVR